eukprot:COSAG05_NODE_15924_length_358_cov_0.474903_1_plen_37_part_01
MRRYRVLLSSKKAQTTEGEIHTRQIAIIKVWIEGEAR